jgi:hypothetical protein
MSDEACFIIIRWNGNYLRELVYFRLNGNPVAEEVASSLCEVMLGDEDGGKIRDSAGYTGTSKILRDINNANTTTILALECDPELSKQEIVTEFDVGNFPEFKNTNFKDDLEQIPDAYALCMELSRIYFTDEVCTILSNFKQIRDVKGSSTMLVLMEICNKLKEAMLCNKLKKAM